MQVVSNYAYFDHAAVSPLPTPARDAIAKWLQQAHELGDANWMQWHQAAEQTRAASAKLLNAQPSEIALIPSTTYGINLIAHGLDWQPGDSMVLPDNEFPSNSIPWQMLRQKGVDVRIVPERESGELCVDDLFKQVDRSTRLIAISWVGYLSGFRLDLASFVERAHANNVQVFVDAIQGLGAFPLDVQRVPIDYLAADGHKWMLGPEGAGLLFIAQRNLERVAPQMIGWKSVRSAGDFRHGTFDASSLKPSASRFEGGTTNMVGMIGFGASLETLLDCGCNREESGFANAILEMTSYAEERLRSLGAHIYRDYPAKNQSGIISFTVPNEDPLMIRSRCMAQNVVLSVRHHRLRIAIHGYNDQSDVDRLIAAIQSK